MILECSVRFTSGAHVTNTINRLRASSTMSSQAAAQRLGEKLFGPALERVEQRSNAAGSIERWLLHGDPKWYAWCWRSGLIEFGRQLPDGHDDPEGGPIVFASGPRRALMEAVDVVARHGYSKGALLVPGVPEAANGKVATKALIDWCNWCKQRNGAPNSFGVVFGRLEEL